MATLAAKFAIEAMGGVSEFVLEKGAHERGHRSGSYTGSIPAASIIVGNSSGRSGRAVDRPTPSPVSLLDNIRTRNRGDSGAACSGAPHAAPGCGDGRLVGSNLKGGRR